MTLDYHSLCPPRPHMPALAPVTAMAEDAIVDRRGRAGRDARLLPDPAATRGDGAAHDPCRRSWTRSARSAISVTSCRRTTPRRGPSSSRHRSTGPTWRAGPSPDSSTRRCSGCSRGGASRPRTSPADGASGRRLAHPLEEGSPLKVVQRHEVGFLPVAGLGLFAWGPASMPAPTCGGSSDPLHEQDVDLPLLL